MQALGPTAQRWRYPFVGLGLCLASAPAVALAGGRLRDWHADRRHRNAAKAELRAVAEGKTRSAGRIPYQWRGTT